MKYYIRTENLSADFCFIFQGSIIKVTVSGDPVDLALFEKMYDILGFVKEELHNDN